MGLIYRLNFRITLISKFHFFPNKLLTNPVKMYPECDGVYCFMT